jgi:molecular chaperone HscB
VQPPPALKPGEKLLLDKFATLGVPRSFQQDDAAVEARYRELSRKLHPDRFARASAQERRFSLEQTTRLNEAYRTLKDPVRRAEHLLELRGVPVATGEKNGVTMSPEFLEQAMEDREKLLEAKMEGGPEAVEALARGVRQKRDDALAQVSALLSRDPVDGAQAADLLARMRYYARYLDEVEGRAPEM